jgi:hypothetical protein
MLYSVLALLLIPGGSLAQPTGAGDPLSPELMPLRFFAGSCWRASFPGGTAHDTHCFTSAMSGHFLRDRHVVAGGEAPYWGETLYRWDAAARNIHYDYYASDGSHSAGIARAAANGLSFIEDNDGAGQGGAMTIRTSWTREGDDAYVALSESRDGNRWREHWRMRFTRVAAAPAEGPP